MRFFLAHDAFYIASDAAEVAPVHIGIHVVDGPHIVVIHNDRSVGPLDTDQVGKQLSAARHGPGISVRLRGTAGSGGDRSALPPAAAPACEAVW